MEKKEMNDDTTSSRRLLPPLYPGSPITANVPRAGNSHHNHHSHRSPFQHNPAATAHFATQLANSGCKASSSSYQQPPSPLSRMTHASAGVGGSSNTVSQETFSGSGCAADSSSHQAPPPLLPQVHSSGVVSSGVVDGGSFSCDASQVGLPGHSYYQMPPPSSLDPVPMLGGGHTTFFSSPDTFLASVEDLAPLTCTQPPLCWPVDQALSEFDLPAPLLTQSTASIDFGLTVVDPEPFQYMDLGGSGGHLNTSTTNLCPPLPQPYSSCYTGITQAPWTPVTPLPLTSSSSMPTPVANFIVKKEAVDVSWGTSQLGKNNITSGGSSSAQPYSSGGSSDIMVHGSKPNQMPAPLVVDFADGLFTQNDIDKIMADKDLRDMVVTDPKKVRSRLRSRITAERSRQRKIAHLSDLELQVEQLQEKNKSLSVQMQSLQSTKIGLRVEKNKMMLKEYALQQEMQLKNDLNETLNAEVHHLKLIAGEIIDSHVSNSSYQERSPQMMQPEHPRKHNRQLAKLQQDQEL